MSNASTRNDAARNSTGPRVPLHYGYTIHKMILLASVVGLALGLRLYHLGQENFWIDEVAYVEDAAGHPAEMLNYSTSAEKTLRRLTPLPHLLTHLVISYDRSEAAARLPSALFGTLEVLVICVLGIELFSWRVGLLAGLLLAASPLHLWYSQEARWYAQWSFLTSCSYLALLRIWRSDRPSSWIYYGLATILNIYSFIYSAIMIGLQNITVWFNRGPRAIANRFLLKFVTLQVLAAVVGLPVIWLTLHRLDQGSGTPRMVGAGDLPYTFFTYAAGFTAGPTLAELHTLPEVLRVLAQYPIVLAFFAVYFPVLVLGLRKVVASGSLASALLLPWLFGLPVVVFLVACATNLTYQVRYTLPSLSAFVLVISCGLWSIRSKTFKAGFAGAILLCSGLSVANLYWNARYDKEQVKAALARIKSVDGDNSPVVSIGQIGDAAKYYGNGLNVVSTPDDRCDAAVIAASVKDSVLTGSKKIWVIAARDWNHRITACLNELARSYLIIDHQRFTGTEIWLLKRRFE